MDIKTFVFLDCETTGLPYEEHNRTKITELNLIAVETRHLLTGRTPRVQGKLNICFNPRRLISSFATDITGLSNDLLEFQPQFTSKTVDLIELFLDNYEKPICLVAHNGFFFDFPILRAEINKCDRELSNHIYCVDSLNIFRLILNDLFVDDCASSTNEDNSQERVNKIQKINETTPKKDDALRAMQAQNRSEPAARKKLQFGQTGMSFKLEEIYYRLYQRKPSNSHMAEADTFTLIECVIATKDKFISISLQNMKKLSDIPMMTAGTKIGT